MTVSLPILLITACNYARLGYLLPTASMQVRNTHGSTKPIEFLGSYLCESWYGFLWSSSLMVDMWDRLGVVTKCGQQLHKQGWKGCKTREPGTLASASGGPIGLQSWCPFFGLGLDTLYADDLITPLFSVQACWSTCTTVRGTARRRRAPPVVRSTWRPCSRCSPPSGP